jgi:hypothetical protein
MRKRNAVNNKSTAIERVAELSMKLGHRYLPDESAKAGGKDFTQQQLLSCLILRAYLKTTYRGLLETLAGNPPLRQRLSLKDKLPHHTTLQKFKAY